MNKQCQFLFFGANYSYSFVSCQNTIKLLQLQISGKIINLTENISMLVTYAAYAQKIDKKTLMKAVVHT